MTVNSKDIGDLGEMQFTGKIIIATAIALVAAGVVATRFLFRKKK